MNEIKRYDQALADRLEHINMPPEDMAWAAMKEMLEKDDDPPVVPFFRRPGCLLPALVAVLLLMIGGWLYFKKDTVPVPVSKQMPGSHTKNAPAIPGNNGSATVLPVPGKTINTGSETTAGDPQLTGIHPPASDQSSANTSADSNQTAVTGAGNNRVRSNTKGRSAMRINAALAGENESSGQSRKKNNVHPTNSRAKIKTTAATTGSENPAEPGNSTSVKEKEHSDTARLKTVIQPGTPDSIAKTVKSDSNHTVKKDSLPRKKTTQAMEEEQEPKTNQWQVAAGLAVYQPLPVAGEPTVPYNHYGRKGSLTDYIPAVYFRLYRVKKWFIHTEFRYGAPQSVKPFDYKQQVAVDSSQVTTRTVFQLRKTYYHQVPLSVDYYVLPGLSVGAGIIYNRFSGAVARQEVYRSSVVSQDTLVSSSIVRDREAGKLIKNHFQWSAGIQYQWKRLTIGGRYSADINPYIKYPEPNNTGNIIEKKAKALNVFIRYDLWRSKKWGN